MKKIIILIMAVMLVGLMIGCSEDIVSPEIDTVEYVVGGDSGDVSLSYIDGQGGTIEMENVELPYSIEFQVFEDVHGHSEFGCSVSSVNLINYTNVSIKIYFSGVLKAEAVPDVTDTNFQTGCIIARSL